MIVREKRKQASCDCSKAEIWCLHGGPHILITYQDSPGAPENENIRERPYDVEETASKDITVGDVGLTVTNYYVYIVKDTPACCKIMDLVRGFYEVLT